MIAVSSLIAQFQQALANNWGYIYGKSGQVWTQADQNATTNEMAKKYGSKWIGHHVADCSGLFVYAFKQSGGSIYHGSNSIWNKSCSAKGKLSGGKRADGQPIKAGTAVFIYKEAEDNRSHIGLYVGNDTVIEAKGTQYGVVTSKLSRWDEWGELKDVNYSGGSSDSGSSDTKPADDTTPSVVTLKRGSRGEAVSELQAALNKLGYDCGNVDGIFGAKTENAVRKFQAAKGLVVDGKAGVKTFAALEEALSVLPSGGTDSLPDDPAVPVSEETVTITLAQYKAIEAAFSALKDALGVVD